MIRAPQIPPAPTSPRAALSDALGGTLRGRDAILVGDTVVWASVAGVVRVGGTPVGVWSDGTEALAERVRTSIAGSPVTLYAADETAVRHG